MMITLLLAFAVSCCIFVTLLSFFSQIRSGNGMPAETEVPLLNLLRPCLSGKRKDRTILTDLIKQVENVKHGKHEQTYEDRRHAFRDKTLFYDVSLTHWPHPPDFSPPSPTSFNGSSVLCYLFLFFPNLFCCL